MEDEWERPPSEPTGHPIAIDPDAESASATLPAFLARPPGAPVYHGFRILADVEVDGFHLGMISDWEAEEDPIEGDAFLIAPDDSRAGLVWEIGSHPKIAEVMAPEETRWGVWAVTFPHPMSSRENARRNLAAILPLLRPIWELWRGSGSENIR